MKTVRWRRMSTGIWGNLQRTVQELLLQTDIHCAITSDGQLELLEMSLHVPVEDIFYQIYWSIRHYWKKNTAENEYHISSEFLSNTREVKIQWSCEENTGNMTNSDSLLPPKWPSNANKLPIQYKKVNMCNYHYTQILKEERPQRRPKNIPHFV